MRFFDSFFKIHVYSLFVCKCWTTGHSFLFDSINKIIANHGAEWEEQEDFSLRIKQLNQSESVIFRISVIVPMDTTGPILHPAQVT